MPRLKPLSDLIPGFKPASTGAQTSGQQAAPVTASQQPAPAAPVDQAKTVKKGTSQLQVAFVDGQPAAKPVAKAAPKPVAKPAPKVDFANLSTSPAAQSLRAIDTREVFFNGNAASGKEIDAVLKHYGSPHAGQGETIARICREQKINPILLLAVLQQESSFGNKNNLKSLKDENIANPWSVHFNEGAKGIAKLRLKDGSMPSFEQSLKGAINTLKKLAGESETPLATAGKRYSTTASWTNSVTQHYMTQMYRIVKTR
ncbi:MAG TPA: hypothetical protein V6D23_22390 [Candidatus Obscuribacterales bacterium]